MSGSLDVLQRIRDAAPRPVEPAGERCELCADGIDGTHGHLVDLDARTLVCACPGCYLLFDAEGAGGSRYRAVPRRFRRVPGFELTTGQWESFQIPVSVAFFFRNSALGGVCAFYPGPAGATESELPLDAWQEVADRYPELGGLRADVEALLVRATADGPAEGFVVPIDSCYELVGHLRRLWRGFDGGREARDYLDTFFAELGDRAR